MSDLEFKTLDELYEQLADTKLQIALSLLADEDANQLEQEREQDEGFHQEAEAHFVRMMPRLAALTQREQHKTRLNRLVNKSLPKAVNIAAAVVLMFFISLSTALATSSTVRVRVMQLIMHIEEQYTRLSLMEDTNSSFDVPAEWKAKLYPTYIPEGYALVSVLGTELNSEAVYENGEGKWISLSENDEYGVTQIDTEDAQMSESVIGDRNVVLVTKNSIATVFWSEQNCYYVIQLEGDVALARRITEGLIRIR